MADLNGPKSTSVWDGLCPEIGLGDRGRVFGVGTETDFLAIL
jgi:hypothetical protein